MHQYAKLTFHQGLWRLRMENALDAVKTWMDKRIALAELASEGWEIIGSHSNSKGTASGSQAGVENYSLRRTIQ